MPLPPQMNNFARELQRPGQSTPANRSREESARQIARGIRANAQAMQVIGQGLVALVEHIKAPKEVIRDQTGRAVGIRRVK